MEQQTGGVEALTTRVQAVLHRVRAFDRRRPLVWDGLLTGFFVVAALTDARGGWRSTAAVRDVPVELVTVLSLALSVPLLWRRRHPGGTGGDGPGGAGEPVDGGAAPGRPDPARARVHRGAAPAAAAAVGAVALLVPPLVVGALRFPHVGWDQLVLAPLWAYALVVLGAVVVRTRQDHTASLVERAHRLEVERDQQARLAAA